MNDKKLGSNTGPIDCLLGLGVSGARGGSEAGPEVTEEIRRAHDVVTVEVAGGALRPNARCFPKARAEHAEEVGGPDDPVVVEICVAGVPIVLDTSKRRIIVVWEIDVRLIGIDYRNAVVGEVRDAVFIRVDITCRIVIPIDNNTTLFQLRYIAED